MAKIGFAIIFFLIVGKTYSQQQNYLVLIDADNDQTFRVRIGDTLYNSSTLGHLVIPHLKDSTYNMAIGFPKKEFHERIFSIRVNKKDQGFQLKNLGEKGWALYNWQTRELKMPLMDSSLNQTIPESGTKKDDAFSRLMSAVVNDTSVMYNAFATQKPLKDSLKNNIKEPEVKNDSSLIAVEKDKKLIVPVATVIEKPKKEKNINGKAGNPGIRKLSERSTNSAKRITYIDAFQPGSVDTITIFILFDNQSVTLTGDSTKKIIPGKNKKKSMKGTGNPIDSTNIKSNLSAKRSKSIPAHSDCKNIASDSDLNVLRANILTENTIEAKIEAADKYFKTKCFSVTQLKILGELFASNKSRYNFFGVAYPYISDRENISQLATLLTDTIYINRFKEEMIDGR